MILCRSPWLHWVHGQNSHVLPSSCLLVMHSHCLVSRSEWLCSAAMLPGPQREWEPCLAQGQAQHLGQLGGPVLTERTLDFQRLVVISQNFNFFFLTASCLFGMNSFCFPNYLSCFNPACFPQIPGILGHLFIFKGRALESLLEPCGQSLHCLLLGFSGRQQYDAALHGDFRKQSLQDSCLQVAQLPWRHPLLAPGISSYTPSPFFICMSHLQAPFCAPVRAPFPTGRREKQPNPAALQLWDGLCVLAGSSSILTSGFICRHVPSPSSSLGHHLLLLYFSIHLMKLILGFLSPRVIFIPRRERLEICVVLKQTNQQSSL